MNKQKNIFLFFTMVLILINTIIAKNYSDNRLYKKVKLVSHDMDFERESNAHQNQNFSLRSQTDYYLDTFDSGLNGWALDNGWIRTDMMFHSPDYSMNSSDNNSNPQLWQLTSPLYLLPEQPLNETIHYSFWLRNDMLDGDGDGDEYLDDFFSLSLLEASEDVWNTTDFNSYDGRSYW